MSKHYAADEEPPAPEMSWIQGLVRPADSVSTQELPFYRALVPRAPRHAAAGDESDDHIPAATDTSPMGRLSTAQVDRVIDRLDDLPAGRPGAAQDDTIAPADAAEETPLVGSPVRRQPGPSRLRKPAVVVAAVALCLLTIAAGSMSLTDASATDKNVDGRTDQVTTHSGSVGGLAAAGIWPTDRDSLVPGVDSLVPGVDSLVPGVDSLVPGVAAAPSEGSTIFPYGPAPAPETAPLGLVGTDRTAAANRSRAVPLQPITTEPSRRTVGLVVGGRAGRSVTTSATTVGQLLREERIIPGPHSSVSPAASTRLVDGLLVTVRTVVITHPTAIASLPAPAATTVADPTMAKGSTKIVQAGRPGAELLTYQVTTVNGKQTARTVTARQVVLKPVGQVTGVGTGSGFTYRGRQVFTNDTSFGVNWDGLAMCESTHNPRAVNANPSAGLPTYGMFQFDLPTWASVGGSGNPIDASPEEQLMRAKLLYQSRGLQPWACRNSAR